MSETKIEWADVTWNPITGCDPISEGCINCYAKRMANRLRGYCGYPADDPFRVTLHPDRLDQPLRWRKPRRVFVCSMGDLFHEDVPFEHIDKVLSVAALSPRHTFMLLTKRPRRMLDYFNSNNAPEASFRGEANAEWLLGFLGYDRWSESVDAVSDYFRTGGQHRPNLWLGVTAENQARADERIPLLLQTPAAKRFVSCEPLLGPINARGAMLTGTQVGECSACGHRHSFTRCPNTGGVAKTRARSTDGSCAQFVHTPGGGGIDWVISGGETGPGARPDSLDWYRSLRDQCSAGGVPFFMKKLSGGEQPPEDLMVREFSSRGI